VKKLWTNFKELQNEKTVLKDFEKTFWEKL